MDAFVVISPEQSERIVKAVRTSENAGPAVRRTAQRQTRATAEPGIRVLNDAGETIPALSVAVVEAWDNASDPYVYAELKKPYTTFRPQIVITGEREIEDQKLSFIPDQRYYRVKYDSGTPAIGEGWGPKPGQWTISKGFPGCRIVGIVDATNKIALVELVAG